MIVDDPDGSAPELAPEVAAACPVCGAGRGHRVVCTADEIREQQEYLRRFHRRRLRPRPSNAVPHHALEDRADFTQRYATDVVACETCGLLFRSPRPRADAVARAYVGDRYGHARLAALFESQRELHRRKARFLERRFGWRRGARVVEVASFVGGFLAAGRERGWETTGFDPGEEVATFCEERGLPVVRAKLEDVRLEPRSVDGVVVWNALDQIPRPLPMLRAARRALRPGGVLAVRVPNGRCFEAAMRAEQRRPARGVRRAALAWNNLLAFPYLYGYSPDALDRLLAPLGFARVALVRDVLPRASDGETRAWAAWEERCLELALRTACAFELLVSRQTTVAPWFDAYHRLRE